MRQQVIPCGGGDSVRLSNNNKNNRNLDADMNRGKMFFLFSIFCVITSLYRPTHGQLVEIKEIATGATAAPLGCHRRLYTYRITQADDKGLECWDYVRVWSCWGRCDSSEISDWKFPYKRSYHPVCVHATRQPSVTILRNCDPAAGEEARRYEYMEALSCHCHTCSTLDTSCEAPANNIVDENSGIKMLDLTGSNSDNLDYE